MPVAPSKSVLWCLSQCKNLDQDYVCPEQAALQCLVNHWLLYSSLPHTHRACIVTYGRQYGQPGNLETAEGGTGLT